jgi:hypothetical protein
VGTRCILRRVHTATGREDNRVHSIEPDTIVSVWICHLPWQRIHFSEVNRSSEQNPPFAQKW